MSRLPTNVPGLDLVLNGGLEPGAVVVLAGAPGTGKTIMAQQICFTNATAEHQAIYYTTLSEPHTKLVRHLEPFSFYDPDALGSRVQHVHLGDLLRTGRRDGLAPLVTEVVRQTLDSEPSVVVIDSAKMLRDYVEDTELRAGLYDLTSRIAHTDTVLLLLGEYAPDELRAGVEFSLADGIIYLDYEPREPTDRRTLRVVKMRGGSFRPGKHATEIGPTGTVVFPRIETLIPDEVTTVSGRLTSGVPGLDDLMGGGIRRGDATLVSGPSGAGKTILALQYLVEGIERGERCLYVSLHDTADQLTATARTFGWDLGTPYADGRLVIHYVPMGNLDLDVLATAIRASLAEAPIGRVAMDSLAELALAAREVQRFPAYKRSLIGLIRATGSSLLVTSESTAYSQPGQSLGSLLFLFDNIVQLYYADGPAGVGRALNIGKMRNSAHDMTPHGYTITHRGLAVGPRVGVTDLISAGTLGRVRTS